MAKKKGNAQAVYNSAGITLTDGDETGLFTDSSGNLLGSSATLQAGEDLVNDVVKVEQRFTPSYKLTSDTLVKTGAGFLHSATFTCNDAAPTAGSIILHDGVTEAGSEFFNHTFTTTPFTPFTVLLDVEVSTGIYAGFTTTADVNVFLSYR